MANTAQQFEGVFFTYRDVKEANPGWSDQMIEDYLSIKRNTVLVAETTDTAFDSEIGTDNLAMALINKVQAQVGSGNPLTSDETGFTVDTTKLTVDMDEA